MGLDMYLIAEKYIGSWRHSDSEEKVRAALAIKAAGFPEDALSKDSPSIDVRVTIGYWRKANAIHRWFVENIQDGHDNCQSAYVDPDALQELRGVCQAVLEDHSRASEELPAQAGFFFGETEYNEWYFKDLEATIEIIDKALRLSDEVGCELYYRASW